MITQSLNASGLSPTAAPKSGSAAVGKDEFLRLFVTQLRYQDPLSPLDSAGFTAQLAQFSSLEQLTTISGRFDRLLLYQGSLQNTLMAGLVGKRIGYAAAGGAVSHGAVTKVVFEDDKTWLVLDGGGRVSPGDVREIL